MVLLVWFGGMACLCGDGRLRPSRRAQRGERDPTKLRINMRNRWVEHQLSRHSRPLKPGWTSKVEWSVLGSRYPASPSVASVLAAKRRKNAAHDASRGLDQLKIGISPRGAKESTRAREPNW